MSASCPSCGHGTSGCVLTDDEWAKLRQVVDDYVSECVSFSCNEEADEVEAILGKLPKVKDDEES